MKNMTISNFIPVMIVAGTISLCSFSFVPQDEPEGPWTAPASADKLVNPLKLDEATLTEAKALYKSNCEQCHGVKGDGYGWQSQNVAKKIAPIASAQIQKQTDGAIFWKITQGNKPMPGMKKALTDTQRWKLVMYVRELAKSQTK